MRFLTGGLSLLWMATCAMALTVPQHAGAEIQAQHYSLSHGAPMVPHAFEPRAPRGRKTSTKRPSKRPTKKHTKTPTKNPAKKPVKKPTEKPIKRPTQHPKLRPTARPTQSSKSSTTSAHPDTYKVPYPTKAVNICDGLISCEDEYDSISSGARAGKKHTVRARNHNQDQTFEIELPSTTVGDGPTKVSDHLDKRGGTRTFDPLDKKKTKFLKFVSLPYIDRPDFFPIAKREKIIFDFASPNDDDWKVKATSPPTAEDHVVEHIIELQTVKLFIEKLVGAGNEDNTYTLKNHIDPQWFRDWWNIDLDGDKVAARNNPDNLPDLKTVNTLIFQALGTKTNIEDFVMLESSINEMKMRLWKGVNPMSLTVFKNLVRDVLEGDESSDKLHSTFRTILAVLQYMNNPEVTKRLRSAFEKSAVEFANIPTVTGEDVKDSKGGVVKMGVEWKKYMQAQLDFMASHTNKWISKRTKGDPETFPKASGANKYLKFGLIKSFQDEIDKLHAHEQEMKKKPKEWEDKKKAQETKLKKKKDMAKKDLVRIQSEIASKEQEMGDIQKKIRDEKDETKKSALEDELKPKKGVIDSLRTKEMGKNKVYLRACRAVDWWEPNRIRQIIEHLETDLKKFKVFDEATIKMPTL
ncbi:hypothetical protein P171DRAFT_428789 [Karstenula rhodostoma CBS 690.94]|uniref:Uncharacterized protein n=1 Tax=Karstenula rhodostoma CBS 690.94 TaxID=1392251 RepID=A0A9P4PQX4_9PLEO|nr:hypothetical protein P171DRAFT_428789 [Karstenula rhodostoma CBS 690.94]